MRPKGKIEHISCYAPEQVITSLELEDIINRDERYLPENIISQKFGVYQRRFATQDVQASDLASRAARKILAEVDPSTIDCLIFAAGSSDLIEPATASIIQSKLQLNCPAFDIKNACNSFVCGLQVADAFITSGQYKNVLVVTGEKLSTIIKLHPENKKDLAKRLACLSMGDAGAAALITRSEDESGIHAHQFETHGDYWHLCTVPGGGTMNPHDGSKVYFEGKTLELRNVFMAKKGPIVEECLSGIGWDISQIDHFFMHHVSENTFDLVAKSLGVPRSKFFSVLQDYGNMASASIPFAICRALESGQLKKGDKIMLIGLASGISISIQLITW